MNKCLMLGVHRDAVLWRFLVHDDACKTLIGLKTESSDADFEIDADIVALTIAEHMPWDAIRLRQGLNQLAIFNN